MKKVDGHSGKTRTKSGIPFRDLVYSHIISKCNLWEPQRENMIVLKYEMNTTFEVVMQTLLLKGICVLL